MPKKDKKMKNAKNKKSKSEVIRNLTLKTEGQEYARVLKMLGNRRVECECFDGKNRLGRIRPTRKQNKVGMVEVDHIVLVGLREFEDDKCDVMHIYDHHEIKKLQQLCEIPFGYDGPKEEDTGFIFDKEDEENQQEELNIDEI